MLFAFVLEISRPYANDIRPNVYGPEWKPSVKLAVQCIPHEKIMATSPTRTGANHKVSGEVHLLARVVPWILEAPKICPGVLPGIAETWKRYVATVNVGNWIIFEPW